MTDPAHPPDHPRFDDLRRRLDRLEDAAVEAEIETGVREETVEEATRHLLWRVLRIVAGTVVTVLGVILLALPGPGLVVVAVGLGILSRDVPFARRLLDNVNDRIPRDQEGNLPRSARIMLVLSLLLAVGFTCLSLWWTFFR